MHFALSFDVIVELYHARLLGREHSANLIQGPCEVVAVVVERIVGILARVKTAIFLIRKNFVHPKNDAVGRIGEWSFPILVLGEADGVQIILEQFGVVVGHLFEVRHEPALIHRVPVKPSR